MSIEKIDQQITRIIREQLGVHEALPHHSLIDDLADDSLDIVELTMALESEFGIEISDDVVAEKFKTVQGVIDYIRSVMPDESEGGAA